MICKIQTAGETAKKKTKMSNKLPETYYEQAREVGYRAVVALCFGPFKLSDPSAVTGFKTVKRAIKYARELQAEFPKARIEVLNVA